MVARGGSATLTGTHWLYGDTVIDDIPGTWRTEGTGVRVTGADGLTLDGEPITEALVYEDSRLWYGEIELLIIRRGEDFAVRAYDVNSEAARSFQGIDTFEPDRKWVIPAQFTPADPFDTVHIEHSYTDRVADYPLLGTLSFEVDGQPVEVLALHGGENIAHITFRDGTSGKESYGAARFLFPQVPQGGGPVELDFNRASLPPCAFSDAFVCPLPPEQNVLPFRVEAGEKSLRSSE